jgi:HPr kinase/phosphorylase
VLTSTSTRLLIHATTVSVNGFGVLIRGPSGSGKSDLALQLMESSGTGLAGLPMTVHLVADDQTEVHLREGHLRVSAPATIAGKLEVRGYSIIDVQHEQDVPLILVVDLLPWTRIERLPEEKDLETVILGHRIARIHVGPGQPSAAARVRLACARLRPPSETAD